MRSSTRAHLRIAIILASSSLGLALWRLYVAWRLFSDWKWQGLFFNPSILVLPGRGFLDLWRTPGLSPAGVYFPLVLLAAFALAIALFWNRRDALTGATAAYALVAVSLDYPNVWSGVANGERATYELPLLLITTFATLAAHATTLRRASLTVFLIFALYQLFTSEAAAVVRTVVGL